MWNMLQSWANYNKTKHNAKIALLLLWDHPAALKWQLAPALQISLKLRKVGQAIIKKSHPLLNGNGT